MSNTIDITSLLVQRLRQKDVTALDYLYDHYSPALLGIIKKTVNDHDMAEEVLHDVFLRVWDQVEKFDPDKATFFTWMYRIARNKAIDATRSRDYLSSAKSVDLIDFVNTIEAEEKKSDPGLLKAIKELGEACFKFIQLNFFMGYSHAEISKNEEIALGSVKTKIRSCLKSLKKKLTPEIE